MKPVRQKSDAFKDLRFSTTIPAVVNALTDTTSAPEVLALLVVAVAGYVRRQRLSWFDGDRLHTTRAVQDWPPNNGN